MKTVYSFFFCGTLIFCSCVQLDTRSDSPFYEKYSEDSIGMVGPLMAIPESFNSFTIVDYNLMRDIYRYSDSCCIDSFKAFLYYCYNGQLETHLSAFCRVEIYKRNFLLELYSSVFFHDFEKKYLKRKDGVFIIPNDNNLYPVIWIMFNRGYYIKFDDYWGYYYAYENHIPTKIENDLCVY